MLFRSVLMVQYAHYHRDRRNIATHLLGIPLIVLALGVWLAVPLPGTGLTLAWAFWVASSVWYLSRGAGSLGFVTVALNALWMALGQAVAAQVKLPTGYSMTWSGQYENMIRVRERLKWIVPATEDRILVQIDGGPRLPLENCGTGIHHLVILGTEAELRRHGELMLI